MSFFVSCPITDAQADYVGLVVPYCLTDTPTYWEVTFQGF